MEHGSSAVARPSTGVALAVTCTLVALAALGWTAGLVVATVLAALAGASFVAVGLLGAREELPVLAVASLVYVVAVALSLGALGAALFAAVGGAAGTASTSDLVATGWQSALFVIAVAVATFGALSVSPQPRVPRTSRAIVRVGTYVFGVLSVAAFAANVLGAGFAPVDEAGRVAGIVLDGALSPTSDRPALGTFLLTAAATMLATAGALGKVPIAVFAPRERRTAIRAAVGRWTGLLFVSALLAFVFGFVFSQLPDDPWTGLRRELPGAVYDGLLAVTTSEGLRLVLVSVTALAVATVLVVSIAKRLRIESVRGPAQTLARGFGGIGVLAAVFAVGPDRIVDRLATASPATASTAIEGVVADVGPTGPTILLFVCAFGAVWLPIGLLGLLGVLRIVPARTAAAVLAGLGIGAATIAGGLLAGPSILLAGTLTVAVVVWDVGSYDRRLRSEIGSAAPSRRPELVHASATLVVGIAVAVVVSALATVVPSLVAAAPLAGIAAFVAVVLLLVVLRG